MKPTSYASTGRYLLYVLLTALLIGLGGCGSGGGSSSSSSGSGSTASGSAQ